MNSLLPTLTAVNLYLCFSLGTKNDSRANGPAPRDWCNGRYWRGAWVVDVSTKVAGKRQRSIKTFGVGAQAKAEAQAYAQGIAPQAKTGKFWERQSATVADLWGKFAAHELASPDLRPLTVADYKALGRLYLILQLGDRPSQLNRHRSDSVRWRGCYDAFGRVRPHAIAIAAGQRVSESHRSFFEIAACDCTCKWWGNLGYVRTQDRRQIDVRS
jgi:hypothetical protein